MLLELGQPVVSEKDGDGRQTDYFRFFQGQHGAAKAGKGIPFGALAVTTPGLSEIVTNPVEGTSGAGKETDRQASRAGKPARVFLFSGRQTSAARSG